MHARRLAALLTGAWIAGTLLIVLVATHNLRSADDILSAPSNRAAPVIQKLGHDDARALLRYQAAELNRWYFVLWEWTETAILLAVIAALIVGRSRRPTVAIPAVMLAIVTVLHWGVTPQIVTLGRALDFVPAGVDPPGRGEFWTYHGAYSIASVVNLGLGALLAAVLLARTTKRLPKKDASGEA